VGFGATVAFGAGLRGFEELTFLRAAFVAALRRAAFLIGRLRVASRRGALRAARLRVAFALRLGAFRAARLRVAFRAERLRVAFRLALRALFGAAAPALPAAWYLVPRLSPVFLTCLAASSFTITGFTRSTSTRSALAISMTPWPSFDLT
jgi:hypothetical protein